MRGLKRQVTLGERAAELMQASKVDLQKHEREVKCGCMLMLVQTGVNVWEGASRVLSQTGMKPLQASTALGESSSANAYSNCVTREMSQWGRMWQDSCNDSCIMLRGKKWLAYLFSGGAFLGREGGFLEYHAALDVVQGEGLCVGM